METVAGFIAAAGFEFTVTVLEAVPVHPLTSVTVTVYEVVVIGETVMFAVTAALLHEKELPPFAFNVALLPLQIVGAAGEIDAIRLLITVTVFEADAVQPFTSVAVTE